MNTGLSNSGIKKQVITQIQVITHNQVAKSPLVEPNFLSKFLQFERQFDDFFYIDIFIRVSDYKYQTKQITMIHCKNLSHLQEEIFLKRQVYTEHLFKQGIDGGGGFLKVSPAI